MFADAIEHAAKFTFPVIISRRPFRGDCTSGIATFVVVNNEGWIVTANHVIAEWQKLLKSKTECDAYEERKAELDANSSLNAKQRKRATRKLGSTENLSRNVSVWWATDGVSLVETRSLPQLDIAVGRLEPFDPDAIESYPVVRNPDAPLRPGTSLCRLGFPLYQITPTFDEDSEGFTLPPGTVPLPRFPIEGILTRNIIDAGAPEQYQPTFIETSSPGLKGQSGGPIFDRDGVLWGIQLRTQHFELGFQPKPRGSKQQEHQFLNVGWGLHPRALTSFLNEAKIAHELGG